MLRPRGHLVSARKPGIDPIIGNLIQKLVFSIPTITYGDQFPGRQATFGDMHYYTGDDTTDYKKNNWYIRTTDADANWQSMNATSVLAENIQTGTIGAGVKVTDYLSLYGGEMIGEIDFSDDQTFPPEKIASGTIPPSVSIEGYVPALGGSYLGNIDMTDHNVTSIKALYGLDNLIYINMNIDGHLTLGADEHISLVSPIIDFTGTVTITGGIVHGITNATDTYNILATDSTIVCNKAAGFTATLPTAVVGQIFTITNIGAGDIIVDGAGGDLINGELTKTLVTNSSMTIQCTAANTWRII